MSEAYTNPPKFQLSKFFGSNKEYQIVVRTQDATELIHALEQIKPFLDTFSPKVSVRTSVQDDLEGRCEMHGVSMTQKTGDYGPFWSHMHTDEQGNKFWCDGKKLKPAKQTYKPGWN